MKAPRVSLIAVALGLSVASGSLCTSTSASAQGAPDDESPASSAEMAPIDDQPSEEAKQEASTRFRRGVDLYRDGDYRAALIEFQRAYEIAPNYRVLFNIGQASFAVKEYVDALEAFEGYLSQGGDEIAEARRETVSRELDKLRSYVAKIALDVKPEGAEVAIDDVVIGTTPLTEPVPVSAGRRKVTITKPGFTPLQRYVDIAGGEAQSLEIQLMPLAPTTPAPTDGAPAASPAPPPEEGGMGMPFWVSLGITGALAVGAGVMGGLTIKANGDYEEALDTFPGDTAAIDDAKSDLKTFSATTDILMGLTAASAVVTVVLAFTGGDDSSEQASESARVRFMASPVSAGLVGQF